VGFDDTPKLSVKSALIMEIERARKILGKDAYHLSNSEIEQDLEVAEMLKELFFTTLPQGRADRLKTAGYISPKVP